ncbi:MAG TPA: hypothetical protein VGG28_24415 [Kofleriaceae bacterium]|jgi:hypothetical protein
MRSLVVAFTLLAFVHAAAADPAPKRRTLAAALSLIGSVAPYALLAPAASSEHPSTTADGLAWTAGAMLIALPSAGHWYAGEVWSTGLGIRLVGAAAIGAVLWQRHHDDERCNSECGFGVPGALELAGAGVIVLVGQAIDIGTAGPAVDRWNRAHVDVMPTVMPMGDRGYGAGVVGRF